MKYLWALFVVGCAMFFSLRAAWRVWYLSMCEGFELAIDIARDKE